MCGYAVGLCVCGCGHGDGGEQEERKRRLRELQEANADHLQEFRRRQARLAASPAQQACQGEGWYGHR